jgi:hypothetical protein
MEQIFQDEEYLRVVVLDEGKFLKRHEAQIMVGYDKDLRVDGKAVCHVTSPHSKHCYLNHFLRD